MKTRLKSVTGVRTLTSDTRPESGTRPTGYVTTVRLSTSSRLSSLLLQGRPTSSRPRQCRAGRVVSNRGPGPGTDPLPDSPRLNGTLSSHHSRGQRTEPLRAGSNNVVTNEQTNRSLFRYENNFKSNGTSLKFSICILLRANNQS